MFTKYIVALTYWSIYLSDIKVRNGDGDDKEMLSQPAPVPLTFQQPAEHLRTQRNFDLFTNEPKFTASIRQTEELFKIELAEKQNPLSR